MWLERNVNSGDPATSAEMWPWPVTNFASWWGACTVQEAQAKRKKYSSRTREHQRRRRAITWSSPCFCMAMLPQARNSGIGPEIILIVVKFDCGLTIVKYTFPKWYLEKLVPWRSKQCSVVLVPLALKQYFQLLITIWEPSLSLPLATVICKLIFPPSCLACHFISRPFHLAPMVVLYQ